MTKEKKVDRRVVKRRKPITGQSGPRIKLAWEDLNEHEQAVATLLWATADKRHTKEVQLATRLSNLETRNAYRRLVCAGYVKRVARGVYMAGPAVR